MLTSRFFALVAPACFSLAAWKHFLGADSKANCEVGSRAKVLAVRAIKDDEGEEASGPMDG